MTIIPFYLSLFEKYLVFLRLQIEHIYILSVVYGMIILNPI